MKLETENLQISIFSRFWVKIPCFYHFLSKFQVFSRPGKENDKIPGFPGRVGTLYNYKPWSLHFLKIYQKYLLIVEPRLWHLWRRASKNWLWRWTEMWNKASCYCRTCKIYYIKFSPIWSPRHFYYVIFTFWEPTHSRDHASFFLLEDCLSDCKVIMV